jgi:hypothetical protein
MEHNPKTIRAASCLKYSKTTREPHNRITFSQDNLDNLELG